MKKSHNFKWFLLGITMYMLISSFIIAIVAASPLDGAADWAVPELQQAFDAGLIIEAMHGNWTQPTSRLLAAEAIFNLIVVSTGKSVEQIIEEKGFDMADGFDDTDSKYATFLKIAGISAGVGNNRYDPDGTFTRAQMVTMLGRVATNIFGMDLSDYPLGTDVFTDVPGWTGTNEAIGWAAELGITRDISDTLFDSDGILTNQQTGIFIFRAFDKSFRERPTSVTINGVQYSMDLTWLSFEWQGLTNADIEPLKYMTNLTGLDLKGNRISNLSALSSLINLTWLDWSCNYVSDLSSLSSLTNLISLDLTSNPIHDISALSYLTKLENLVLNLHQLDDINPLSGLTNLTDLVVRHSAIVDISPLSNLTNLVSLNLEINRITDISPLSNLSNLTHLNLSSNRQLSDISALSGLTNLTKLSLADTQIIDISQLSGLTNLRGLFLSDNQITDTSALGELSNLRELWLDANPLSESQIGGLRTALPNCHIVDWF